MKQYIYTRDNHGEFRTWQDFKELFQNQDMLQLFGEMKLELDKYKFGFLLDENLTEEYTPEEASDVAQNINDQISKIPSPGIVPIFETVQIERFFGDPNAKPVNNLRFSEMEKYCKILKEAEDLFLQVQREFPNEIPRLPSKNRV